VAQSHKLKGCYSISLFIYLKTESPNIHI
jgi:hypothetical protein